MKDANCKISQEDRSEMECNLVAQVVENGRTTVIEKRGTVSRRTTDGYFVATMINTAEAEGDSECDMRRSILSAPGVNFDEDVSALTGCSSDPGSAYFDVWRIETWNNAE